MKRFIYVLIDENARCFLPFRFSTECPRSIVHYYIGNLYIKMDFLDIQYIKPPALIVREVLPEEMKLKQAMYISVYPALLI